MSEKHLTAAELAEILYEATDKIVLGGEYRHVKTKGLYTTVVTTLRESDLEPMVVYIPREAEALGLSLSFARPIKEFNERFKRV